MMESRWPELDVEDAPFGEVLAGDPPAPPTQPANNAPISFPVHHLKVPASGQADPSTRLGGGMDRVDITLSTALAQAFFDALQVLQRRQELDTQALQAVVDKQHESLQAARSEVMALASTCQELLQAMAEQKTAQAEAQDRLSSIAASLDAQRQCDARQESALRSLREEVDSLSASWAVQLENVTGRMSISDELGTVKTSVAEAARRLDQMVERVDRHAMAIENLGSHESLGETALDRFVQIWSQLRAAAEAQKVLPDPL